MRGIVDREARRDGYPERGGRAGSEGIPLVIG
jgi:hypothetical protein